MSEELCGYCGEKVDECIDTGECNYGLVGQTCTFCSSVCRCDDNYSAMKEAEADDYYAQEQ